jgi:hypothetical protein
VKKVVIVLIVVVGVLLMLVLMLPTLLSTGVARRAILKRVNANLADGSLLEVRQTGLPPATLLLDATADCTSLKEAITYTLRGR